MATVTASSAASPTRSARIVVSPEDKREYRTLTLANEMNVMLVSDPTTDKAAASMEVGVGFFADPPNIQGIAHFCEHMLFLGTEKYPDEKEYKTYLSSHSGSSNAYTDEESTVYYFDVGKEHLEGALDRFAQFFIAPLFTVEATEREMKAVDSEHSKNLQTDVWRLQQLRRTTSSHNHPYHKFGTGSLETLNIHEDIRDQLLQFHQKYYSANIMNLAIYGRESLDELAALVEGKFSAVINKDIPLPVFGTEHPMSGSVLSRRIDFVPVKEYRKLSLDFATPHSKPQWRCKPAYVVSHLIGHEGPGSILAALKTRGWANSLSAGTMFDGASYSMFSVGITLTEEGLKKVDEIVKMVFAYVEILKKGIPSWVHPELALLQSQAFRFADVKTAMSTVSSIAARMKLYPATHYLAGPYLIEEQDPALVTKVVDALTPSNMRMFVGGQEFAESATLSEKWYGVKHSDSPVGEIVLDEVFDDLYLPTPNDLIASDFSRHLPDEEHLKSEPFLLKSSTAARLWYYHDQVFNVPKAYMIFNLIGKAAYSSPKAVVLASIFTRLVADSLNTFAYNAEVAGLAYSFSNSFEGLTLTIKGYNHKQLVFLKKIVSQICNLEVRQERFDVYQKLVSRGYRNFYKDQPYERALYEVSLCMENLRWTIEEYIQVVDTLTMDDLVAFIPSLLDKCFIECLVAGNVSSLEAEEALQIVLDEIAPSQPSVDDFVSRALVKLEKKSYLRSIPSTNDADENSAIEFSIQIGEWAPKSNALLSLFIQCTSTEAFNVLRTQQQLGYLVWTGKRFDSGVIAFRAIIQSSNYDPLHLEKSVSDWIDSLEKYFVNLSDSEFERFRSALVTQKLVKSKSLQEEIGKMKAEIDYPRAYLFNRNTQAAAEIEKLTKEELITFYRENFPSTVARRQFSVHVTSLTHAKATTEAVSAGEKVIIENYAEFRKGAEFYTTPSNLSECVVSE
eukprot:TRINITY_DN8746_c0_g1_i1.p1 TRINITY_DN8746_c0_g1~~TRINITY_DN8746_c0_g1_i1.p1  ORF type:complete len:959 (+),score=215.62 TRINITY_DN8746_c0_g1_i1:78-2954(+)